LLHTANSTIRAAPPRPTKGRFAADAAEKDAIDTAVVLKLKI
jgi:hypothetical protein